MMPYPTFLSLAEGDVRREREAQDDKWGEQNHPDGTGLANDRQMAELFKHKCQAMARTGDVRWRDILLEEVMETLAETGDKPLRNELVQVAAVAIAWIEAIDRRNAERVRTMDAMTRKLHTDTP